MTKTKKGFLRAGAIISIVMAVFMILMSLGLGLIGNFITEDIMLNTYKADSNYEVYHDSDTGEYIITDLNTGDVMTNDDIEIIVTIAKTIINVMTVYILGMGIANLVIAIKVLVNVSKERNGKGAIITLLVLSVLCSNLLTAAFMIVALCLKNKPTVEPTLENITEINS